MITDAHKRVRVKLYRISTCDFFDLKGKDGHLIADAETRDLNNLLNGIPGDLDKIFTKAPSGAFEHHDGSITYYLKREDIEASIYASSLL